MVYIVFPHYVMCPGLQVGHTLNFQAIELRPTVWWVYFTGEHFRGSVAVCDNNIHKYCIAYKKWLIPKCNGRNFYSRNTLMPAIRKTSLTK